MHTSDERFILASKENLTEDMATFSLKVIKKIQFFSRYLYYCAILCNYYFISQMVFSYNNWGYIFFIPTNFSVIRCVRDSDLSFDVFFFLLCSVCAGIFRAIFSAPKPMFHVYLLCKLMTAQCSFSSYSLRFQYDVYFPHDLFNTLN